MFMIAFLSPCNQIIVYFLTQFFMAVQCDQSKWSHRDRFYTSFFCCLHLVVVLLRILTTFKDVGAKAANYDICGLFRALHSHSPIHTYFIIK